MKIKNNKNFLMMIIALLLFISGVILICSFAFKKERIDDIPPSNEQDLLLGQDRLDGQTKVTSILQNYINGVDNFLIYAKNNNIKEISLEEFSQKFKVDTQEFDNLDYKCKKETTMILIDESFNNYFFTFDCEEFYLE